MRKTVLFFATALALTGAVSAESFTVDPAMGTTFGETSVDGQTIVNPVNSSGEWISQQYNASGYILESVTVDTTYYQETNATLLVERSGDNFDTVSGRVSKTLREGQHKYSVEELGRAGSYRLVIQFEGGVDVGSVSVERNLVGTDLFGFQVVLPQVPYGPRLVAMVFVFGFFSLATYWRRNVVEKKLEKFRRVEEERLRDR